MFDQDTVDAEQAVDGWYALLTNLPDQQVSAEQVFLHHKGQSEVERRYSEVKGRSRWPRCSCTTTGASLP